ncbi:MAG: hypothetical protein K0R08_891 [Solimicrobium sp.]|jgi:hypothetical protein|nr:hypothetical protein [Solimicrobium sp.]
MAKGWLMIAQRINEEITFDGLLIILYGILFGGADLLGTLPPSSPFPRKDERTKLRLFIMSEEHRSFVNEPQLSTM